VLSLLTDTFNGRLGSLALVHGPIAVAVYAYGAALLSGLPPSRRSSGSRLAALTLAALAVLWTGLVIFHLSARLDAALAAEPWFVRFERYGFYADLLLQFALAYAMVRLLFEDGEREALDTRAQLELLQTLPRMTEFHDAPTGLLNRHAFETSLGLDFARASFGSVVRMRLSNVEREIAAHGSAVGETLLKHFAGVLGSAVREHDWVYRWDRRDFLVVMPRAVPTTARARMQQLVARAAPLLVAGVDVAIRAEAATAVAPFSGGEDLNAAVATVASDSSLQ
jgi:GGDEF domain-containing protein